MVGWGGVEWNGMGGPGGGGPQEEGGRIRWVVFVYPKSILSSQHGAFHARGEGLACFIESD